MNYYMNLCTVVKAESYVYLSPSRRAAYSLGNRSTSYRTSIII